MRGDRQKIKGVKDKDGYLFFNNSDLLFSLMAHAAVYPVPSFPELIKVY